MQKKIKLKGYFVNFIALTIYAMSLILGSCQLRFSGDNIPSENSIGSDGHPDASIPGSKDRFITMYRIDEANPVERIREYTFYGAQANSVIDLFDNSNMDFELVSNDAFLPFYRSDSNLVYSIVTISDVYSKNFIKDLDNLQKDWGYSIILSAQCNWKWSQLKSYKEDTSAWRRNHKNLDLQFWKKKWS